MKTHFIPEVVTYSGEQLKSLFAYLNYGIDGDSIVAWVGPCDIPFEHMVDGEDLREQASIKGSQMLHLIAEVFDRDLFAGVALQRLTASIAKDILEEVTKEKFIRSGDDVYWQDKKLSISIATKSPISTLMHFALNISNVGTPVATCALKDDFKIEPQAFAHKLMERVKKEYDSIIFATRKAKPVG